MEKTKREHEQMIIESTKDQDSTNPPLLIASVSGSVFKGDCDKNIHWYAGVYSQGQWIYNECSYCKKDKMCNIVVINKGEKEIDQILETLYSRVTEPDEAKEQLLLLYGVIGRSEQLKAEDKDLPFADYLEKWYELPRYEKVYDRKDGKGTDTEDEVIKNYRRAFRL